MSPKNKKAISQRSHSEISIRQQCKMFRLNQSTFTSKQVRDSEITISMRYAIERVFTQYPFFGSRQIMAYLCREDKSIVVGITRRNRVRRLMAKMGLETILINALKRAKLILKIGYIPIC